MRELRASLGQPQSIALVRRVAAGLHHPTESELQARVEHMVDEAIASADLTTLNRIAVLHETGWSTNGDSIRINFADDARLFDASRWFVRQFKDLIHSGHLMAQCLNYPPRSLVESSCQKAIDRLALPIKLTVKQQNKSADRSMAELTLALRLNGPSMSAVVLRFKRHLVDLAKRRYRGTIRANWSDSAKVRQFLVEVIAGAENSARLQALQTPGGHPDDNADDQQAVKAIAEGSSDAAAQRLNSTSPQVQPRATAAAPAAAAPAFLATSPTPESALIGSATAAGLPFAQHGDRGASLAADSLAPDLVQALLKRIELVRRRTGTNDGATSATQHREVCRALADAIKEGDPLDVAALAMVLYEGGLGVRLEHLVRTPFDGSLHVLKGNTLPDDLMGVQASASTADSDETEQAARAGSATPPAATEAASPAGSAGVQGYYEQELLTTNELAKRIKYEPETIRNRLKDTVFLKDIHYVQPFGRKTLFIWGPVARRLGLQELISHTGGGNA